MFKPNGMPAKNICPVILLNIWAHHLNKENNQQLNQRMIFAGLGKPSYLLNEDLASAALQYWQDLIQAVSKVKPSLTNKNLTPQQICEEIINTPTAIDYELPSGCQQASDLMSQALTKWYGISIETKDFLFTVGGLSALKMIFQVINEKNKGRIITPLPYYPFYNDPVHGNHLHFIDVINEPGYRLTAEGLRHSLQNAISLAANDGQNVSAFLFCDPNNPVGTVVGREEWKKIAEVLKNTSDDIPIILDEAYAELIFDYEHYSLLKVAPELKNRLIIIRSGTKGFSSSGERMGVVVCFNEEWREELLDKISKSYVHSPKSLQVSYAKAMFEFTKEKMKDLSNHYQIQTKFVQNQLKKIKAELPDPAYCIEGTFYVLANLRDLFRTKIPAEAVRALGKEGSISTDVEICYSLLFRDQVMVCPLSYFGADPTLGFVRITCSGGFELLQELLDRIEHRLIQARNNKVHEKSEID